MSLKIVLSYIQCNEIGIYPYWAFPTPEGLDDFIEKHMDSRFIPGLGVCLIKAGAVARIKGFGWADIENEIPYDPEQTLQNIGSVSKTFTATAVMQLWEQGRFKLDDDVNSYLSFKVKNPRFPEASITFRQLLTHRSSIKDGPSYGESYACGDPQVTLKTWIEQYFTPGGETYDADENFHVWKPGQEGKLPAQPRPYSNVGFGLLG
ncbi:MAG: serine hydrolase domain-containing protein, partial [Candidatus Aminicenantaceae bacterium]